MPTAGNPVASKGFSIEAHCSSVSVVVIEGYVSFQTPLTINNNPLPHDLALLSLFFFPILWYMCRICDFPLTMLELFSWQRM